MRINSKSCGIKNTKDVDDRAQAAICFDHSWIVWGSALAACVSEAPHAMQPLRIERPRPPLASVLCCGPSPTLIALSRRDNIAWSRRTVCAGSGTNLANQFQQFRFPLRARMRESYQETANLIVATRSSNQHAVPRVCDCSQCAHNTGGGQACQPVTVSANPSPVARLRARTLILPPRAGPKIIKSDKRHPCGLRPV